MRRHIAIYARVSCEAQDLESQCPILERWAKAQGEDIAVYRDKFTGRDSNVLAGPSSGQLIERGEVTTWWCGGSIGSAEPRRD